jgi:hypothetical protein
VVGVLVPGVVKRMVVVVTVGSVVSTKEVEMVKVDLSVVDMVIRSIEGVVVVMADSVGTVEVAVGVKISVIGMSALVSVIKS